MADTIKTGTTLIEDGAPMPESVHCESEPWTFYYMAGEIIRESRTAMEKKASTEAGTGLIGTPECGDVMKLQIRINPETRVIGEPEFETFGFGSAIARSSLGTEGVKGKTSRKRWPSRTRISSASSALPPCNPAGWNKILQNWGKATPSG
jgi:hypothetical protein